MHDTSFLQYVITVPSGVNKIKLKAQLKVTGTIQEAQFVRLNPSFLTSFPGNSIAHHADNISQDNLLSLETPVLYVSAGDTYYVALISGSLASDTTGNVNWFAMEVIE
jgi:hypothetical protein